MVQVSTVGSSPPRRRQNGVTYLGLMFAIAFIGIGLAIASQTWSAAIRRAKERELLWVGQQYSRAIQSYYVSSPGNKNFPTSLDELLSDHRFPIPVRHIRSLYPDPIETSEQWGLVTQPGGGIIGVFSQSHSTPIKSAGFPKGVQHLNGAKSYRDWIFSPEISKTGP
jgi:type II secretory pathway pseudopilin PulG